MTCERSVTTKTGTFTAYPEQVSHCEAAKLCRSRGEILAPFYKAEDMKAVQDMFVRNMNDDDCDYAKYSFYSFHIGLDVEVNADGSYTKTFSNGLKWNNAEHGNLYERDVKTNCPIATYRPHFDQPFGVGKQSFSCRTQQNYKYICLKPAGQASPLVQNKLEPVSNKLMFGVILVAASVAAFATCVAIFFYRKVGRLQEKFRQFGASGQEEQI